MTVKTVTLNNNLNMPQLGLGTINVEKLPEILPEAIDVGYRLIDTAANYNNETEVGIGIKNSSVNREDLFVTSKLKIQTDGYNGTLKAFEDSLKKLQLDYLDLYLIHQPYGDVFGEWRALEKLYHDGKVKAIGVSNFAPFQLADLSFHSEIKPMVDQIEMHPFFQETAQTQYALQNDIQPESWSPFGETIKVLSKLPILKSVAEQHDKAVAQIILRWLMQRNVVAIPRSGNLQHLKENIDIFDFDLSSKEMDLISQLDTNHSTFIDHLTADGAEFLSKVN
ncbi:aldo/keto reductase [Companilactobacillus alimentarius]|uniref:aldo/keto reductase n=1 Tax=Companilactobacillus alimentarius TaxID=1602 RepID=UPI0006EFBEF8|nr:aldo/keto reductase [Companilactobacillus alimentarius]KRK75313.1 aldehyde reductase [Companilactobacillus alimentarius DSM 20249]